MAMRARAIRTAGFAALPLAALLAGGCSVNPATGQRQLAMMGEAQEVEMGRQADREISGAFGLYEDPELQAYVDRIGRELAARTERPNLPWQIRVVDDPVVNAFALPGGFLYVTRGILAHVNSEAEMAAVIGHEIGHVTGRHSVEQMSKAQLANVGLAVAMIASEDVRQFGEVAQLGLNLLFLKFSRDDEREADDLGLRYVVNAGYDPREMLGVFQTLDRVSAVAGGERLPNWLATHPNPEDRGQRLAAQIAALPPERQASGRVERDAYLRRLQGLVFGADPREGFFEGDRFYHPGMAFRLAFPAGWKHQNQKQAVLSLRPEQDAVVVLTLAGEGSPAEAARAFFAQQGIERGNSWRSHFHHFRTAPAVDAAGRAQQQLRGIVGFVAHQGRVLRLLGMSVNERWPTAERDVAAALASFGPLTDRRYLDVQPARLRVVAVDRPATLAEIARRHGSTADLDSLAILNGIAKETVLEAGRLVKLVAGGELPSGSGSSRQR
ncbi:MAG: M48 family metalloprotease [Thermoanaerobaculia bacterium]|nr:M48 family metalloprotease [Thermoanaerobaculia bacterium]